MSVTAALRTAEERRTRQRRARREAILAAARRVFARNGFDGTTMVDVAREAGVAAGTVYLYYASKLDLFAALNARLFEAIIGAMRDAQAPPEVRGGTRSRIHAVFEASREHRDLLRLVFLNPDPRSEVARRMKLAGEERLRPLAELLRAGMDAGIVGQGDPALLSRLIVGLVVVALHQCFIEADGREEAAYEDAVVEMIAGALTPRN